MCTKYKTCAEELSHTTVIRDRSLDPPSKRFPNYRTVELQKREEHQRPSSPGPARWVRLLHGPSQMSPEHLRERLCPPSPEAAPDPSGGPVVWERHPAELPSGSPPHLTPRPQHTCRPWGRLEQVRTPFQGRLFSCAAATVRVFLLWAERPHCSVFLVTLLWAGSSPSLPFTEKVRRLEMKAMVVSMLFIHPMKSAPPLG